MIVTLIANPCFHSVLLYRISNFFYKIHLSIVAKIIWYINRLLFSVDIDYRCDLAGGFVLIHGIGVVIGRYVQSEGSLTLYQGVTLGGAGKERLYEGEILLQPLLKENVTIYTDAKVFGPVIIGKNNHIKAGEIVVDDIIDRDNENE